MNTPPTTPKRKRPIPKLVTTSFRDGINKNDQGHGSTSGAGSLQTDNATAQILQPQDLAKIPIESEVEDSRCGSPRTQVASRLNDLELRDPRVNASAALPSVGKELNSSDQARTRLNSEALRGATENNHDRIDTQPNRKRPRFIFESEPRHVQEAGHDQPINECNPKGITPPPEHSPGNTKTDRVLLSIERNPSPPPLPYDMSDRDAGIGENAVNPLIWHDSEITGHLGLDPDDDGTGINGVGFRPTSQQAYARSQRRKQQLREWRERESREERKRRYERRGHAAGESVQSSGDLKGGARTVRFA